MIPHGNINFHRVGSHVNVAIDTSQVEKVLCYVFDIDTTLRRLVGNGSLRSRLYKVYLHALTSHCLPDSLTWRTGTEEALHDLSSAAVSSFNDPEPEKVELELLYQISALTPNRLFYPPHLKIMQAVGWDARLSPLSQHDDFYQKGQKILDHRSRFRLFKEGGISLETAKVAAAKRIQTEPDLVMRAAIRNGTFQLEEFGGSNLALGSDCKYTAREVPSETTQTKEANVCAVARRTDAWSTSLDIIPNLQQQYQTWGKMRIKPTVTLGYESRFLQAKLSKVWCSLYNMCTKASRNERYSLMFLLSTLIFSETPIDMQLIWTLLAFATIPKSEEAIPPPDYESFDLAKGDVPTTSDLSTTIRTFAVDYSNSNESNEGQHSGESMDDWSKRKQQLYATSLSSEVTSLTEYFEAQWPCPKPSYPEANRFRLLETHSMRDQVNALFFDWYKNRQLLNHARITQCRLDKYVTRTQEGLLPKYTFSPSVQPRRTPTSQMSMAEVSARTPMETLPEVSARTPRSPCAQISKVFAVGRNLFHKLGMRQTPIETLLEGLHTTSESAFEREYVESLSNSFQIFRQQSAPPVKHPKELQASQLGKFRLQCNARVEYIFDNICDRLKSPRVGEYAQGLLSMAGLWPRVTPTSLLGLLATPTCAGLEREWKHVLVDYGLAVSEFQWATRQNNLALAWDENETQPMPKVEKPGHRSWDPMEHPDWLLLELENDLLIRRVQADLANEMISPQSGQSQCSKRAGPGRL